MNAKIYANKGSPFWIARFHAWDARLRTWKIVNKSTKTANQNDAQRIADELAAFAQAAGPGKRVSREYFTECLQQLLRLSGHREIVLSVTWADYSERWLASLERRGNRVDPTTGRKNLADSSLANYKSQLKSFAKWLGTDVSLPLEVFDGAQLQEWYDEQLDEGLAATTINNAATTLFTIFERAKNEGLTTRNPVSLINRDPHVGNTRDPFTLDDQGKILSYLRSGSTSWLTRECINYAKFAKRPPPCTEDWLTTFLLGLCTSQRLQDCANAVLSQFEETKDFLIWTPTQRKGGKAMRIPIVEPAASHLREILRQPPDTLFVAPTLAGLPSGKFYGLSRQAAQIIAAAGVVGRRVEGAGEKGRAFNSKTFHSTRHTCNSALANAGVPSDIRRLITGHADDRTNERYTHLADATKAQALVKSLTPRKKAS